jgi:hypothetical protein
VQDGPEGIARYDTLLGRNWRSNAIILSLSQAVVEERVALYDGWFGTGWRVMSTILTNNPRTVISSVRALKTVGITQENTAPGSYFGLLNNTVANKREKARVIRQELLGHRQVHIYGDKTPISEIVQARKSQSQADRELEAQEIEEFRLFIQHLGAKGLGRSIAVIRDWAHSHGYPVISSPETRAS